MTTETQSNQRLHATVHGHVQGVGFRQSTVSKAQSLGVKGWVRNVWDGTVEAVAEGSRADLNKFLDWLRRGPRAARVERVESDWEKATGEFDSFRVVYSKP